MKALVGAFNQEKALGAFSVITNLRMELFEALVSSFSPPKHHCYPLLFPDEVARLLRDHQQNRELLRRLGKRYYQVVYPIQVLLSVFFYSAVLFTLSSGSSIKMENGH